MFINSACVDDNETFVEREYGQGDLTSRLVADLVRSLDGNRHTLVILRSSNEAHMAIGGDASSGLGVYATADNTVFYNLLTNAPRPQEMIFLVAGGQPGDYAARNVVTLEEAVAAAISYAETGVRVDKLQWEVQRSG